MTMDKDCHLDMIQEKHYHLTAEPVIAITRASPGIPRTHCRT